MIFGQNNPCCINYSRRCCKERGFSLRWGRLRTNSTAKLRKIYDKIRIIQTKLYSYQIYVYKIISYKFYFNNRKKKCHILTILFSKFLWFLKNEIHSSVKKLCVMLRKLFNNSWLRQFACSVVLEFAHGWFANNSFV